MRVVWGVCGRPATASTLPAQPIRAGESGLRWCAGKTARPLQQLRRPRLRGRRRRTGANNQHREQRVRESLAGAANNLRPQMQPRAPPC